MTEATSLRALAAPYLAAPFGGALLDEKLDAALSGDESLQLTVQWESGHPVAFAMVEHIAGGHGTWRLHVVCGEDSLCAEAVERALAETWVHGGRLAVAELPDEETFAPLIERLRAIGFHVAGTVPDFFADDVALIILAKGIEAGEG
jgi:hypothetical protein